MMSALPIGQLFSQVDRQSARGFSRENHAHHDPQFRAVVADDRDIFAAGQPDKFGLGIDIHGGAERAEDDRRLGQFRFLSRHQFVPDNEVAK